MILNKDQAEAVYDAMCAFNVVGARLGAVAMTQGGHSINFYEFRDGTIRIENFFQGWPTLEQYTSQAEFAKAYGLI